MKKVLISSIGALALTGAMFGAASAQTQEVAATSKLGVNAWVSPTPVKFHKHATLFGKTKPGALCSASITYSTGRTRTQFGMLVANSSGKVSWKWREAAQGAKNGKAVVQCTLKKVKGQHQVKFKIKKNT